MSENKLQTSPGHAIFIQLVTTWIGLVITLFVTSLFFFYIVRLEGNYHENFAWAMIVSLSFSTMQYGHYWPSKVAIKIFLATMFFFGLHINTAYHSYLINVLTNPRTENQIDTVDEAMAAGLIFQVGENTVEFFKKEDAVSLTTLSLPLSECQLPFLHKFELFHTKPSTDVT